MMFGAVIADAGQRQAERELDDILEAWRTDTSARTQGLAAASTVR